MISKHDPGFNNVQRNVSVQMSVTNYETDKVINNEKK